jgi:hypothetical protein
MCSLSIWFRSHNSITRHGTKNIKFYILEGYLQCPRWRCLLRHGATRQKVAVSIPDDVGIFYWHNPSGRSLTEINNKDISRGGG